MEQLSRFFENPATIGVASFILAIYGPRLSPKLPDFIRRAFNNGVFRFIILILILMSGSGNFKTNLRVTMILAIIFVILMSVVMKQNVQEDFKSQVDEYYANYNLYAVQEGFESRTPIDDFDELDELDKLDFSSSIPNRRRQNKNKRKMVNINVKCDTSSMGNLTMEQHQQLLHQQEQQLELQKEQNDELRKLRQDFEQQYNHPPQHFNHPQQQFNHPQQHFNHPQQHFNHPQQQFNHPQQHFNHPPQHFNRPPHQQLDEYPPQQQYPQQKHGSAVDCNNGLFCDTAQTCISNEQGAGMLGGCSPFPNATICNDRRFSCPAGTECWNSECKHPNGSMTEAAANVDSFKIVNMERKYPHQLNGHSVQSDNHQQMMPIIEKKGRIPNPLSNFARTEDEKNAVGNIITAVGEIFSGPKSNLSNKCKTLVKNAANSSLGKECLFEINDKGQTDTLFKGGMNSVGHEFEELLQSELSPSANEGKTYTVKGIYKDNLAHTSTITLQEGSKPLQTYGISSEYMEQYNNADIKLNDKVMVQDNELITFKNNSPNSTGIKLTHSAVHALNMAMNKPTESTTISYAPPQLLANNNSTNKAHLNGVTDHINHSIQHSFTSSV